MAEDNKLPDMAEEAPKKAPRPVPDFSKDVNAQKRLRAGKRSSDIHAGKTPDEVASEEAPAEGGGIVAAARDEVAAASGEADKAEGEMPTEENAEPAAEEAAETPAEENAEPEAEEGKEEPTAIEKFAEEESKEPEHQGSDAIQQFAKEESQEPEHQGAMDSGEYQAPEGESHDDLIDKYHEALMFGDTEQAKSLYKELQNHRYAENTHRNVSEGNAKKAAQEFLDTATELAAKHPELAQDGLEADKVLALKDVYWQSGMKESEALRKAVADLYPDMPMAPEPASTPEAPAEEPVPEAPVEEPAPEAPAEEAALPDMSERVLKKKKLAEVPSASARNEPAPEKKEPTRTDAIQQMKARRGQA